MSEAVVRARFEIAHDADTLWRVIAAFTAAPWMQGVESVGECVYDGRVARALNLGADAGLPPIIEYLLSVDAENRQLSYGVVRHSLFPLSGYQARLEVTANAAGSELSFTGSFEAPEDSEEARQNRQLLEAAYQMMADGLGQWLDAQSPMSTAEIRQ